VRSPPAGTSSKNADTCVQIGFSAARTASPDTHRRHPPPPSSHNSTRSEKYSESASTPRSGASPEFRSTTRTHTASPSSAWM